MATIFSKRQPLHLARFRKLERYEAFDMDGNPTKKPVAGPALDRKQLESLGLSVTRIETHQSRIQRARDGSLVTTLNILGACTTNNGAVLPWKKIVRFVETDFSGHGRAFLDSAQKYWNSRYLVSCIPAAGAASRYLAALRKFANSFEAHLAAVHHSHHPRLDLNTDSMPALPAADRRALRSRLRTLELSADLKILAEECFSTTKEHIAKFFAEIENHLTSDHPLKPIGQLTTSREASAPATTGSEAPSPQNETYMRQHWRVGKTAGDQSAVQSQVRAIHWSEFVRNKETDATDPNTHELGSQPTDSDEPLNRQEKALLQAYAAARVLLDEFEGLSKALVKTTQENDSFLFLKLVEQMSLIPCLANVVVCPAGLADIFYSEVLFLGERLTQEVRNIFETARTPFAPDWVSRNERNKALRSTDSSIQTASEAHSNQNDVCPRRTGEHRGDWVVLEQGNELSTIRFCLDGTPHINSKGSYTRVSAGHGELVNLFDNILDQFPEAECAHIRNIDNIIGTGPERRKEIGTPARLFRIVRDCLEALRAAVERHVDLLATHNGLRPEAKQILNCPNAKGALTVLQNLAHVGLEQKQDRVFGAQNELSRQLGQALEETPLTLDDIFNLLCNLFHWPSIDESISPIEKSKLLATMLQKPLSVFGVVRKETGDIGGGPVFAKLPGGDTVKLCMEMPHATDEDCEIYFGARGKATHFNPVLVFFELQTHSFQGGRRVDFKKLVDDRFWLLAVKEFEGTKVCYHETVLYELIGNSATSNVLFAEVPRTLFKPHKTIFDSLGQDRRSYGFDETLKTQEDRNPSSRHDF